MTTQVTSREQLEARATLARNEFKYFCEFVHNVQLARHQMVWYDHLTSDNEEDRQVAIAAPPEFWKSRLIRMWIEYNIGKYPERCTLLAMNSASQAQKQVKAVRDTIEFNVNYKLTFPHVKPDKTRGWSGFQLFVQRTNLGRPDPTLEGTGVQGPIQGAHIEYIICDDLTDQQDVESPTTMIRQKEWVKGVLSDRLTRVPKTDVPVGKWFSIFTRWGDNDLWDTFTKPPESDTVMEEDSGLGFKKILMPAINYDEPYEWGPVLWPEEYPESRLQTIRNRKGTKLYTLTFLCDPAGTGGQVFPLRWWNRFDLSRPPENTYVIHSWDCAGGESTDASFSVMLELTYGPRGYYTTFIYRDRPRYSELKALVLRFVTDRQPNVVLIEDMFTGQQLGRDFEAENTLPQLRRINPKEAGRATGTSSSKLARAERHAGLMETGQLWIPNNAPWLEDFTTETTSFPQGKFDDQVDALSQALDFARDNPHMATDRFASGNWAGRKRGAEREPIL